MNVYHAPGWQSDWLNAWLAALGVTRLLSNARLAWSEDVVPHAIFYIEESDFAATLASAFPTEDALNQLAVARSHPKAEFEFPRKVTRKECADRAALARCSHDGSLEALVTDLVESKISECADGPFNPPMQRGITLYERLLDMRRALEPDASQMTADSLRGVGSRVQKNGLGFDIRRFPTGAQASADVWVDPVIEFLCFYGLLLFPVRGTTKDRIGRQRRWLEVPSKSHAFTWPVWNQPLDVWAIDALLDMVWPESAAKRNAILGVQGMYGTVALKPKSSSDVSRGYGSERLW